MGMSLEQEVRHLRAQVAELRRLVLQSGSRPANPLQLRKGWFLGISTGSLSAGGTVEVQPFTWSITDEEWQPADVSPVEARDFFLNEEDTVEAGTKMKVEWYRNVWTPTVIYCEPSDNLTAPE
jgi:hypothetical protein